MINPTERFILIKAWRGDRHRYYTDKETGRIAFADQSVFDNPDSRDRFGPAGSADGTLFVDFSRKAKRYFTVEGEGFNVPCVNEKGEKLFYCCDTVEMHYLIETFRMEYEHDGVRS